MIFYNNNDDDEDRKGEKQDQKNLMNKAVGYIISKYIYEIKKYKIDTTKPIPSEDDLYELIKYLVLNDEEFQKYTLDNYRIRICYDKDKDVLYVDDNNQ